MQDAQASQLIGEAVDRQFAAPPDEFARAAPLDGWDRGSVALGLLGPCLPLRILFSFSVFELCIMHFIPFLACLCGCRLLVSILVGCCSCYPCFGLSFIL